MDMIDAIPVARTGTKDNSNAPAIETGGQGTKSDSARSRYAIDDQKFTIPKPLKTALRPRHVAVADGTGSVPAPSARGKSTRRNSFARKKSGTREIAMTILGAILAVPVAQIVLWWVFSADPLSLAPRVFPVVPAIVPPALVPEDMLVEDEEARILREIEEEKEKNRMLDMPSDLRIIESINPVMPIK